MCRLCDNCLCATFAEPDLYCSYKEDTVPLWVDSCSGFKENSGEPPKEPTSTRYELQDKGNKYPILKDSQQIFIADSDTDAEKIFQLMLIIDLAVFNLERIKRGESGNPREAAADTIEAIMQEFDFEIEDVWADTE